MNDWNPRANEIFLAALDCDSTERRQAYVAEACGTDEALTPPRLKVCWRPTQRPPDSWVAPSQAIGPPRF